MRVTGIVANLPVADIGAARDFYTDYLGLSIEGFNLGWVANYRSPSGEATIQLVTRDATAPHDSVISVHVGSGVDEAYAEAKRRGYEIVHPLTEEAWGLRRFFVRAPDGNVINITSHSDEQVRPATVRSSTCVVWEEEVPRNYGPPGSLFPRMSHPRDTRMVAGAQFRGTIRYFRPTLKAGLAVVDIPKNVATGLGGLKQMRVRGKLNGVEFNSNTMPAGGGVLALSLSRKLLNAAGLNVGDEIDVELQRFDGS